MHHVTRNLSHKSRAKIRAYLAKNHGVTEEHFLAVIAARKRFRAAKRDRERKVAWGKTFKVRADRLRAGEGELHGWLRRLSMTEREFCELVGMDTETFRQWSGHCMWAWPVRFLALFAYARNMEAFLTKKGFDVTAFRDTPITEMLHQTRRVQDPAKLILEGLTDEERAKAKSDTMRRAAHVRWNNNGGKPGEDYTPWKL